MPASADYGWFEDQTPKDFDDQIDINLRGVVAKSPISATSG